MPIDHVAQILEEWSHEQPDLDTAPIAVIGRILRVARELSREVERELAQFELNVHEFNALSALRRVGAPYELTAGELSRALLFTSGGLTKLLDRLERSGLVERMPATTDKRGVRVSLTPAGRERQEQAMRAHLVNEEELLAPLDAATREQVAGGLEILLAAFEHGHGRARPIVRQPPAAGAATP